MFEEALFPYHHQIRLPETHHFVNTHELNPNHRSAFVLSRACVSFTTSRQRFGPGPVYTGPWSRRPDAAISC